MVTSCQFIDSHNHTLNKLTPNRPFYKCSIVVEPIISLHFLQLKSYQMLPPSPKANSFLQTHSLSILLGLFISLSLAVAGCTAEASVSTDGVTNPKLTAASLATPQATPDESAPDGMQVSVEDRSAIAFREQIAKLRAGVGSQQPHEWTETIDDIETTLNYLAEEPATDPDVEATVYFEYQVPEDPHGQAVLNVYEAIQLDLAIAEHALDKRHIEHEVDVQAVTIAYEDDHDAGATVHVIANLGECEEEDLADSPQQATQPQEPAVRDRSDA